MKGSKKVIDALNMALTNEMTAINQCSNRLAQSRIQAVAGLQLQGMDDELDIDQPARQQLHIERPFGLFMLGHVVAHFDNFEAEKFGIARLQRAG